MSQRIFGFVGQSMTSGFNPAGEVIVVDYKATSSATKEPSLDDDWKIQYKRQADVYQWLARRQGLKVSDTAYFVYANGLDEIGHIAIDEQNLPARSIMACRSATRARWQVCYLRLLL